MSLDLSHVGYWSYYSLDNMHRVILLDFQHYVKKYVEMLNLPEVGLGSGYEEEKGRCGCSKQHEQTIVKPLTHC